MKKEMSFNPAQFALGQNKFPEPTGSEDFDPMQEQGFQQPQFITKEGLTVQDMPDLHEQPDFVNGQERQQIAQEYDSTISKQLIIDESIENSGIDLKHKFKQEKQSPVEILKELVLRGDHKKEFDLLGHKWLIRALDQHDMILAMDDVKDDTITYSGRMTAATFSQVVYSIEGIDGYVLSQFFPHIDPSKHKTQLSYIIALKRALRAYLIAMPPSVIDLLYDSYINVTQERDKAILELKN